MSSDFAFTLRAALEQSADSICSREQSYVAASDKVRVSEDISDDLRMARVKETVTALYEQLHKHVYRYLLWMRVRPQEAEEIVQESFLRLFSHLYSDGDSVNLKAWLYRVAHNLACARGRKQKFVLETSPERWHEICLSAIDPSVGPEDAFLYKERLERLHSKVMKLSQLQQNCVRLRLEGLRYQEIAETLNTSVSTVAGSLRHALNKLCEDL